MVSGDNICKYYSRRYTARDDWDYYCTLTGHSCNPPADKEQVEHCAIQMETSCMIDSKMHEEEANNDEY